MGMIRSCYSPNSSRWRKRCSRKEEVRRKKDEVGKGRNRCSELLVMGGEANMEVKSER
jgi:hypothetical protein